MTVDEEVSAVAEKLTKAQREALVEAKPTGFGSLLIPPPTYGTALVLLRERCIRDDGTLAPFGLRVRAVLKEGQARQAE